MNTLLLSLCLLVASFVFPCYAQKNDTISLYNGTYHSPTNRFKNDNYMRVYFLNDTTFVFTLIVRYDMSHYGIIDQANTNLRFNGYALSGVGRLVNYNGVQTWIGISDFLNAYSGPEDTVYLQGKHRVPSFDTLLNLLKKSTDKNDLVRESGYAYNMYQFDFSKNKEVNMKGIEGVTRFFEIGDYQKIDSAKMLLGLGKKDDFFKKNYFNEFIKTNAIVLKTAKLKLIPIDENIEENKTKIVINKGEIVRLTHYNFMRYTFVVQYDKDGNVTKSGWVSVDVLQKK